jgi:orotate phosphoribosyltransferase
MRPERLLHRPPAYDAERLARMIEAEAIQYGDFTLASGKRSHYYLDLRRMTLSTTVFQLVEMLHELIQYRVVDRIGGPETGANQIIGAYMTYLEQHTPRGAYKAHGFVVRKEAKGHGMDGLIVGHPLLRREACVLVEDVTTTGESLMRAARVVRAAGCEIVKAVAIVDRLQGAGQLIGNAGIEYEAMVTIADLDIQPPPPGWTP